MPPRTRSSVARGVIDSSSGEETFSDDDCDSDSIVTEKNKRKISNQSIRKKVRVINSQKVISSESSNQDSSQGDSTNNVSCIQQIYEQMLKDFNEENFNSLPQARLEEYENIKQKIENSIKKQRGLVIHLFGREGCGKTHLMKFIINQMKGNGSLLETIPFLDCSTNQIDSLKELCKILYLSFNKRELKSITPSKLFTKCKKMRLIVLDSADCLITEKPKVREQLKKWADSFNCIFICITTNQIVSHENLLIFRPLSSTDLTIILNEKLKTFIERTEKPMFDRNLIGIISKHFEEFDMRHVLKLIKNVISLCMLKNANQVNIPSFFQIAASDLATRNPVSIISSLSFSQHRLLEVLTRKQSIVQNIEQQIQFNKLLESSDSEDLVLKHREDISSLVFYETVSLDHVIRTFNDYMQDFTNENIPYAEVKEMCRVLDDLKLLKLDQMKMEDTVHSKVIISNNIKADSTIDIVTVLVSFETVQEGIAKKKEKTQSDTSLK
ncbi:predicted protein [Naegleria gruberi]|uniref:Predicted protein n=1 Tax=Naegleria gruberi TaxID=5762 RepID=D2UZL5_NAEGR|nr:uncharacterized protein NAEGRDRAFT_45503 [Naegleria gruberi]EFC50175.1 predicted protein [Naegleria gruberi]|eukprot:XP_002682919.1 predicted protein [Naegleria gruberi strain NEG-M]